MGVQEMVDCRDRIRERLRVHVSVGKYTPCTKLYVMEFLGGGSNCGSFELKISFSLRQREDSNPTKRTVAKSASLRYLY